MNGYEKQNEEEKTATIEKMKNGDDRTLLPFFSDLSHLARNHQIAKSERSVRARDRTEDLVRLIYAWKAVGVITGHNGDTTVRR